MAHAEVLCRALPGRPPPPSPLPPAPAGTTFGRDPPPRTSASATSTRRQRWGGRDQACRVKSSLQTTAGVAPAWRMPLLLVYYLVGATALGSRVRQRVAVRGRATSLYLAHPGRRWRGGPWASAFSSRPLLRRP